MTDEIKIHSYPKHIADWRSGTARMSLSQEGAYGRLCDQYYLEGGLECTFDECLRICAAVTKDERAAVKYVLDAKFDKTATGYSHSGMDKRITAIREASAKNQERARLAAEKRWSKDAGGNAPSIPQAMPSKSQKPVKDGSRISNEILSPSGESESEGFSDFVKAYPQPDGVHAAEELWNEIVSAGTTPESILSGLTGACRAWKAKHGSDVTWIPKAKTWLASKGWQDHAPASDEIKAWEGPEKVRKAIIAALGPEKAKGCFAASEWDGDQIIPRTGWALENLSKVPEVKDILAPVRKAA